MSFYRTLKVNEKEYKYNVGKSFVKLVLDKESKIIPISDIVPEGGLEIVLPSMIKDYILNTKKHISKYYSNCRCKGVEKRLRLLPFEREILEKNIYVYYCQDCIDQNADDI